MFPDSLDEPRNMSPGDQGNKKSSTPVIPHANRRKRPEDESFDVVAQIIQKVVVNSSLAKPQEDVQNKEIIGAIAIIEQTALVCYYSFDSFIIWVRWQIVSAGGCNGSTEEGNNRFPAAEGEVVFTPAFSDDDRCESWKHTRAFVPPWWPTALSVTNSFLLMRRNSTE